MSACLRSSRGIGVVEVLIALFVLGVGMLAVAQLFPTSSRMQTGSRMRTTAGGYANEQFEELRGLSRTALGLSPGRHPASGYEDLGASRAWHRYYLVTPMAAPLDSLLRIDATVRWTGTRIDSVRISGYLYP